MKPQCAYCIILIISQRISNIYAKISNLQFQKLMMTPFHYIYEADFFETSSQLNLAYTLMILTEIIFKALKPIDSF